MNIKYKNSKTKLKTKIKMLQVLMKIIWRPKNKVRSCANRDGAATVGCHGESPSLWFSPFFNYSLFDVPSFPVKKLHHKTFSHFFSVGVTLVA